MTSTTHNQAWRPVGTWILAACCLLVSVPTLLFPDLTAVFRGTDEITYFWQPFTAAFEHGFGGFPLVAHLAGNLVLLALCGPRTEKLLGHWRFLLLTGVAIVGGALVILLTPIGYNGASVFIYSYTPVMAYALLQTRESNERTVQRWGILFLMWVVIAGMMGLFVLMGGWDGGIVSAFVFGNALHIVGIVIGVIFTVVWRKRIRERLFNRPET